jgi:23S rRNA (uracil1939-C5)-methyltransferase
MQRPAPQTSNIVTIESLDQEGRGVAHRDGKVLFVEGALPGETVEFVPLRRKPKFEVGTAGAVLRESASRVAPRCCYFGTCGGCSIQHLDSRAQVAMKQRVLETDFEHIGKVVPETMLPAIHGPAWGYRQRARFSVRVVPKKGGVLVGFHEKRSSYVADMESCEVIPPRISRLLAPLRRLVESLSISNRVPQLELAAGDGRDVLVLRHLQPLTASDIDRLRQFAADTGVRLFLQPGGPETAHPLEHGADPLIEYALPDFDLRLAFSPTEFTQVNHAVNRMLVRRALSLLEVEPGHRVADLFCGLGNFSLAAARRGAEVVGIEGSEPLVRRAADNARRNGLDRCATFIQADLFEIDRTWLRRLGRFDRLLIDPPRTGAIGVVHALDDDAPRRIVYVSCNPATLARDAAVLVHVQGYQLEAAGVVNMFPQTSHVESVAVFCRK